MGRQYLDTSGETCTGSALFSEEPITVADFLMDIVKSRKMRFGSWRLLGADCDQIALGHECPV
jgi:hypothetical protein